MVSIKRDNFPILRNFEWWVLFCVVLLSRLPFLSAGYGAEEDSWGLVLTARDIAESGAYSASRLPGHPVHELILALFPNAGTWVLNGLSAVMSTLAVLFFSLSLREIGFRHHLMAGFALAFTPIVFVSSTYTIDYMWALAFMMISLYLLVTNKLIPAGIFLGLAVGCRITSGAMILPFCLMLMAGTNKISSIVKFGLAALVTSGILFFPVVISYGEKFFTYYDQFPYPSLSKVVYKATVGVWGVTGIGMFFIVKPLIFIRKLKKGDLFCQEISKWHLFSWLIAIALFAAAYLRLPQKSGYLVPMVPFVILLLGYFLNSRIFLFSCIAIIISSIGFGVNLTDPLRGSDHSFLALKFTVSGQELFFDPLTGPVVSDYSKRKNKITYTEEAIDKISKMEGKNLIIAGWWYNEILVKLQDTKIDLPAEFVYYIDQEGLEGYSKSGYTIWYLSEQNTWNDLRYNMKFTCSVGNEI